MNFYLFIFSFIFFSYLSHAQSSYLKVEYDFYVRLGNVKHYEASLYIKPDIQLFLYKQNMERKKGNDDIDFHVSFFGKDSTSSYVITDFKKDSIYSKVNWFDDKKFQLQEKVTDIKWTILPETRQIGSYKCQKAVGNFRGRNYTAWFTVSLPVNSAPWKLQGLPGLVLKVSDADKKVEFIFKSIQSIKKEEFPNVYSESRQEISIEQYAEMQRSFSDEVKKRITSKMPRGMKVEFGEISKTIEIFPKSKL